MQAEKSKAGIGKVIFTLIYILIFPGFSGSLYGMIIGALMMFLLAFRIIGEEKMPENELEGYGDYKKKVKYRLIPFMC